MAETNLQILLETMEPIHNPGKYVFCKTENINQVPLDQILCFFREEEAITLILTQEIAEKYTISYDFVASWITLTVNSSLEAVGLTAAFSRSLTDVGISCNVVAGYYHDHIFVKESDLGSALFALKKLSQSFT